MTPTVLAGLVGLASYFAISSVLALAISLWWRIERPAVADANRLLALRLLPAGGGGLLTLLLVVPAFLHFEPAHDGERAGPLLWLLSAGGAFVLAGGLTRIVRAVVHTRRLRLRWLQSASALRPFDGRTPAHLIDVPYPVVAIVGILRPILVVSRDVAGECSDDEVRLIAAHERAHLRARDNLKRLLIDGCPDLLRWTRTGRDISRAWAACAEDAADDAAAGGDRRARIRLASVLLRVARMTVDGSPAPRLASALVGLSGVERRVRRLAESAPLPRASRAGFYLTIAAAAVTMAVAAGNPSVLWLTYATAELVVGFGR